MSRPLESSHSGLSFARRLRMPVIAGALLAAPGFLMASDALAQAAGAPESGTSGEHVSGPLEEAPTTNGKKAARANGVTVTSLFRVRRKQPGLFDPQADQMTEDVWQRYARTQLALIKTNFILTAALRNPKLASLSLIRDTSDPVAWLRERIRVEMLDNSEILAISMSGPARDVEEMRELVNAVARAYEEEAIYSERQLELVQRDAVAQALSKLKREIADKLERFYNLAREAGDATYSGSGNVRLQIDLKRLDRIDEALMRLEEELARFEAYNKGAKATDEEEAEIAYRKTRIADLNQRREKLENSITQGTGQTVELTMQQAEIDQLQRLADSMSIRLEIMDIEAEAPFRTELIQPAAILRHGAE